MSRTESTSAELNKLRGLLSTLPPGDRSPLACLAGILLLTEAVRDYKLLLKANDDKQVCAGLAKLRGGRESVRDAPSRSALRAAGAAAGRRAQVLSSWLTGRTTVQELPLHRAMVVTCSRNTSLGIRAQVDAAKSRARAALLNLIVRKAAPPHLWVPLLFAAIPVMEATPPAFGMADTEQLLLAVQVHYHVTVQSPEYLWRAGHIWPSTAGGQTLTYSSCKHARC